MLLGVPWRGPVIVACNRFFDRMTDLATTKHCFVAGTPVHTDRGLIPIECVAPGDLVLARDEESGAVAYKPVLRTIRTRPGTLVTVAIATADGPGERITGTPTHPFWSADRGGFVPLGDVRVGETLWLAAAGPAAFVTDVQVQRGPPPAGSESHGWDGEAYATYNLEVRDYATYFVGRSGAWVHNRGPRACERWHLLLQKIRGDDPNLPAWGQFETGLARTNTPSARKRMDGALSDVVEALGETSFRNGLRPDGTVDWNQLRSVEQIRAFRGTPNGRRLDGLDLHAHHTVPLKEGVELLRLVPLHANKTTEELEALLDRCPGLLLNMHHHIQTNAGRKAGINSFHTILKPLSDSLLPDAPLQDRLDVLERAYRDWDPVRGPEVWAVARQWLREQGVQ